jgi:Na+/proline symporter
MLYNILFLILYFVALTIVIATGRKKTSPDEYLIASRNLGVWATVSTLFSTYRNGYIGGNI